jgi:hypothetical protein
MQEQFCVTCKQTHRADYRAWSEYFKAYMTQGEFVSALRNGTPKAT